MTPAYRGNQQLDSVNQVKDDCPALREIIRFDQWTGFLRSANDNVQLPEVLPSDATMIQYTSGTTGFPKGALLHHRGLVNNGHHTLDPMKVNNGDIWVTMLPLFHTAVCVICVPGAVAKRCTQLVVETFEPGLVLELIETYKAHALIGVPTMLIGILEHPDFSKRDISSIHTMTSGGSTVTTALVQRFEERLGAEFTIVFGQTECSPVASMTRPEDTQIDKTLTLGGPMPNVEIKIVDPESGQTVPIGQLGEYCTRGYHVKHEYFDMPEATAKTIDEDNRLHAGDLCSMNERGSCKVEGRLKDIIICGGENIYPEEREELLFRHPSIGEVAIVGLPNDRYGKIVGAFIRAAPGKQPDREELFAYLREHLSLSPQPPRTGSF